MNKKPILKQMKKGTAPLEAVPFLSFTGSVHSLPLMLISA
jgi:hypothetical protein